MEIIGFVSCDNTGVARSNRELLKFAGRFAPSDVLDFSRAFNWILTAAAAGVLKFNAPAN